MLVAFVRTERIERTNAQDSDHAAKDIGLLKVQLDEIFGLLLHEFDCRPDMRDG